MAMLNQDWTFNRSATERFLYTRLLAARRGEFEFVASLSPTEQQDIEMALQFMESAEQTVYDYPQLLLLPGMEDSRSRFPELVKMATDLVLYVRVLRRQSDAPIIDKAIMNLSWIVLERYAVNQGVLITRDDHKTRFIKDHTVRMLDEVLRLAQTMSPEEALAASDAFHTRQADKVLSRCKSRVSSDGENYIT